MTEVAVEWSAKLSAWRSSGKSGAAWCRDNGIGYYQFIYWRGKLHPTDRQGKIGHFVPLTVAATPVRLECNGVSLVVTSGFDPVLLREIVSALRAC